MIRIIGTAASVLLFSIAPDAQAQTGSALTRWVEFPVADVPFGPGERLEYEVRYGIAGRVGKGALEVVQVDTMRGHPAYHLRFTLEGGILFAKVDDDMQSWLDVSRLVSLRFDQNVKEVNYKRHRIIDFFPAEGVWRRLDVEESGELATTEPLDDISFLYFVRTLPLVVGETYTLDRYWKDEGNPVTVKVLRKERVKLPAGEFETIVVQPIIKTDGLFSEGGEAEVYFTDDDRRLLVQLKSKVSFGTLDLRLTSYTPGTVLEPGPSRRAGIRR
ncbi:MAG: DUF3108 domain-containing protein [Longimicrobiales bacterium]